MNFLYFGYDHMIGAAQRLIQEGHTLKGVFTFNCDNVFNFNIQTLALAQRLNIPCLLTKPKVQDIDDFVAEGVQVLIVAGYPAKVPVPHIYALNLHPSLLPLGRGLMPTPTIIMYEPKAAGISVHKLTQDYDAGDIIYQEAFSLNPQETADTYAARIAERGTDILSLILSDLPEFWQNAKPQDHSLSSTFPAPDNQMRRFQFDWPLAKIDKTLRAFGSFGSLCCIDNEIYAVYEWALEHKKPQQKPGKIISQSANNLSLAARDGIVHLKRYERLETV